MSIKKTFAVLLAVLFAMQLSTASFATAPADLNQPNAAADSADAILTPSDVIDAAEEIELTQAEKFGLPTEKVGQRTISGREFMELADAFVSFAAPEKLSEWKNEFKVMREVDEPIYRYDAMVVMYHAGQLIGGGYAEGGNSESWTDYWINNSYFDPEIGSYAHHEILTGYECDENGGWYDASIVGYNYYHTSEVSGRNLFYCNPNNCSFDFLDYPSYADGVLAILRLIGSVQPELFDPDLFPFDKPDPGIFDDKLYEKMALYPEITVENLPRWTGIVDANPEEYTTVEVELVREAKSWGYNGIRILLSPPVFDEKFEKLDNKSYMLVLDQIIAEAARIGIHVELCSTIIPGRWMAPREDLSAPGGLTTYHMDRIYGDKYYQDLADELWRTIATRYKDVPSAVLTMLPMQEMWYKDSWYEETTDHVVYTAQDVANYQAHLVDVIHEADPDRIVLFEPVYDDNEFAKSGPQTIEAMKGKPNTTITYNYAGPGIYHFFSLNVDKPDPDNYHHSTPIPPYPFYPYEAHDEVTREYPIKIGGFLPAGTEITINLKRMEIEKPGIDSALFRIVADGEVLYSESLEPAVYNVGEDISYYMNYAESDKQIKVVLPKETDSVIIDIGSDCDYEWEGEMYDNAVRFYWSGIKVHLPDEYAVDQLWNATQYDIDLGIAETDTPGLYWKKTSDILIPIRMGELHDFPGTHDITIYEDVTYSTPYITFESSRETMDELLDGYVENCAGWPGSIRVESNIGSEGRWEDIARFMNDTYDLMTQKGFSWWSNDIFFGLQFHWATNHVYGIEPTSYGRYKIYYPQVLEILQKYMAPGWCEFSAGAEGQGSVSGSQMLIAGGSATLTATPDDGAEFLGWYLDGALVSDNPVYTATVTADTRLVAKFTPDAILGDLNSDGEVTVKDGVLMQRVLAELETDPKILALADLNADGEITVKDGVKMQRILAKLE